MTMMTKSFRKTRESGLHKGDEDQIENMVFIANAICSTNLICLAI
ncbi:hypothetical protein [Bacillus sp. ISL-40]|nr:hypothetical protein [Bacillus sp. ISL-40]